MIRSRPVIGRASSAERRRAGGNSRSPSCVLVIRGSLALSFRVPGSFRAVSHAASHRCTTPLSPCWHRARSKHRRRPNCPGTAATGGLRRSHHVPLVLTGCFCTSTRRPQRPRHRRATRSRVPGAYTAIHPDPHSRRPSSSRAHARTRAWGGVTLQDDRASSLCAAKLRSGDLCQSVATTGEFCAYHAALAADLGQTRWRPANR